MSGPVQIEWTREKLKALREARDEAVRQGEPSFKVKLPGEAAALEFDSGYAKYLIEYLDSIFATHPDQPRRPNKEGQEGE